MNSFQNTYRESRLLLLLGLVQFVNIVDFMMVMPLGPDFATALSIPVSRIGLIGGTYTLAAALGGVVSAFFLDRFPRRQTLLVLLALLTVCTAFTALAWNLESMVAARFLAGFCGGPLTAITMAMVLDAVTPERRGQAVGKVMAAFSAASVLGVPFGLELSHRYGWQAPFYGCALLCALVGGLVAWALVLPPAIGHAPAARLTRHTLRTLLQHPLTLGSYMIMALSMAAGFLIIPNIAAHLQENLGYPREHLGMLYMLGGSASFFGMMLAGKLTDRLSPAVTITLFTATLLLAMSIGFYRPLANVGAQTLSSRVPPAPLRGAYMALQSTVTHLATAAGAFVSAHLLSNSTPSTMDAMPTVAALAMGLSLVVPILAWWLQRRLSVALLPDRR
jgi:predicted MFS family arabinose efflux permease